MATYWDAFLDEFGKRLNDIPLRIILEAFYHYATNYIERAREIIDEYK